LQSLKLAIVKSKSNLLSTVQLNLKNSLNKISLDLLNLNLSLESQNLTMKNIEHQNLERL